MGGFHHHCCVTFGFTIDPQARNVSHAASSRHRSVVARGCLDWLRLPLSQRCVTGV